MKLPVVLLVVLQLFFALAQQEDALARKRSREAFVLLASGAMERQTREDRRGRIRGLYLAGSYSHSYPPKSKGPKGHKGMKRN